MKRLCGWPVLLAGLLLPLPGIVATTCGFEPPVKPKAGSTDRFGDPLPLGALTRLRLERSRAGDQFTAVAFAPDGHSLVSGGQDGVVRVWDLASAKDVQRLEGHTRTIWCLTFAPDGKTLASASDDTSVRLWDVVAGKCLATLARHGGAVWFVSFAPDGKTLASSCEDSIIRLWDVGTGREVKQLLGHAGGVWPVAYAPDGRTIVSGGSDGTVRVWDAATGKEVRQCLGHERGVWPLAVAADSKTAASAGWQDHTLRLWELATGKERCIIRPPKGARYLALSPDGRTLASGDDEHSVRLWDLATGKERRRFEGHRGQVLTMAFSPDGKALATGSADGTILVWNVAAVPPETLPPPADVGPKAQEKWWADLATADAARAHTIIWQLVAVPQQAVPFLEERLNPASGGADSRRIEELVGHLDDDQFSVRERAMAELEKLGAPAEAALRKVLQGEPSLEVRRRAERLLEKLEARVTSPDVLRALRALEVLEQIGTPEARQVLEKLARGAPEAALTLDAKRAVERLARRAGPAAK
jgi:hypothetical protein